jgi:hypothetical protein
MESLTPQSSLSQTGSVCLANLATFYRCRWEVELLPQGLKTQYTQDEFDMMKKHTVEILLYAASLSLVVSRDLLGLMMGQCCRQTAKR